MIRRFVTRCSISTIAGCLLALAPPLKADSQSYPANATKVFSPSAMMALQSVKRQDTTAKSFTKATLLDLSPKGAFIRGIAKVKRGSLSEAKLEQLGVEVTNKIDDIWTLRVPLRSLEALSTIEGITYFEADMPISPKLDTAAIASKASRGLFSSLSIGKYDGRNVIVGIVDSGFDYSHPSFKDSTGKSRIKVAWDQTMAGNAPAGYDYGHEFSGDEAYESLKTDNQFGTHGTHVLGIAAGGSFGKPFVGMAPASDIVLVSYRSPRLNDEYMSTSLSGVLDGVSYVFKKADELQKPAVVNLSLGFHMGPHDGTSLFDQACDKLVGPGKILVGAAGNEGARKLHLQLGFTPTDTLFRTFAALGSSTFTSIDSWGEISKSYCIEVALFNRTSGSDASKTPRICTNEVSFNSVAIYGSDGKSASVSIYASPASPVNQRPRITIYANNQSANLLKLVVSTKNKEAQIVNLWNDAYGYSSNFNSLGLAGYVDGSSTISIGEIGGTGKRIITVGAYTTKNSYKSAAGNSQKIPFYTPVGDIAPFSSRGPTVDGRIKPDLCAPGNGVVSTINSYNDVYNISSSTIVMGKEASSRQYVFGLLQGTSMAAPIATGIVALLLQENPQLTPEEVKQHLANGAVRDSKTTLKSTGANNLWGAGKISATGALSSVLGKDVTQIINPDNSLISCKLYNSRLDGMIDVTSKVDDEVTLKVYDLRGKIVYTDRFKYRVVVDLTRLTNGIYIIRGTTATMKGSSKIIISN